MPDSTVHLYVTEELINDLGKEQEVDCQNFIKTIKRSVGERGICQKALDSWDDWKYRQSRRGYPPYIGYLSLFVLAAGIEGEEFAENAYYPRLRELLGEEAKTGQYPHFDEMRQLWEDLERWSREDKNGKWGIFNCLTVGKNHHIGLPLAQTLLSEKERKCLPNFFAEAGLDSDSSVSEQAITFLLLKHGKSFLRQCNQRLLENNKHEDLRQALIERVVEELEVWDGTFQETEAEERKYSGTLRLCFQLDTVAQKVSMNLRCYTKSEFPEEGLQLKIDDQPQKFDCEEYDSEWSSVIQNINTTDLNWEQDLRMQSRDGKWQFRLKPSPIRFFVSGEAQGLPGLIEISQIPQNQSFYITAKAEETELIEEWGKSQCQGYEELFDFQGLPKSWHLFKVNLAQSDELLSKTHPSLSWTKKVRLNFVGGLRLGKGNKFFDFAPPQLRLEGNTNSRQILVDSQSLHKKKFGLYQLPGELPKNTKINIGVCQDNEIIKTKSLTLLESYILPHNYDLKLDCLGNEADKAEYVNGAIVKKINIPPFNFNTLLPVQGKQRITLLGSEVGQIANATEEIDWSPVWAVAISRKGQAIFCGDKIKNSQPITHTCTNKKQRKQWKDILWTKRKRITPPHNRKQRELWYQYQQEAKGV